VFYVKLIILMLVFLSSLYIGILISRKYIYREKELKEMKNALNILKTKMKFTYESIPEIFTYISQKTKKGIKEIFELSVHQMQELPAGEAWNYALDKVNNCMTTEDKEILRSLGKLLGKTDIDGQISEIELVDNFLDTQIEMALGERKKNEKMYKTIRWSHWINVSYNFNLNL